MSNSTPSLRTTKKLSQPLDCQLKMYAIAAGAAGVSLLALARPAEAEIVYTSAHASLPYNQADYIDLNGDGVPDVRFFLYSFVYHSFRASLNMKALTGGVVVLAGGSAAVLPQGAAIGSSAKLGAGSRLMGRSHGVDIYSSVYSRHTYGPWKNVQNRYLGVSFQIGGETHYGWIRVSVTFRPRRPIRALVTGYAYETVANKPLRAGQTSGNAVGDGPKANSTQPTVRRSASSLGMLAAGADCLPLWRREDEEVTA
jgi:hypothetical protein